MLRISPIICIALAVLITGAGILFTMMAGPQEMQPCGDIRPFGIPCAETQAPR